MKVPGNKPFVIFASEPERKIFKEGQTETLDGSSGEVVNSGDQGRSPRTFISAGTVLLGLRKVMGSDRTVANESLDMGPAAAVEVSRSAFILGERKQTIISNIAQQILRETCCQTKHSL